MAKPTQPISRRRALRLLAGSGATVLAACMPPSTWKPRSAGQPRPASPERLPRWRGFNLIEKLWLERNRPYREEDFDLIAEWGFDFVRLPTDYRIWTISPGLYHQQSLRELDQAISWGLQRGIHVSLCLHRAPGYCASPPREPLDLWADGVDGAMAREQFVEQWRMLATRYQGISGSQLSFNLLNEPPNLKPWRYVRVIGAAAEVINAIDPGRLVIADGLNWAREPVTALLALKVAQSYHGYAPMMLTHYRANWIVDAMTWPTPTWPIVAPINRFLFGPRKPALQSPLVLVLGTEPSANAKVYIRVHRVSQEARLVVRANEMIICDQHFYVRPDDDVWTEVVFEPRWNTYYGLYDQSLGGQLPASTREIRFELVEGDWISFSEIRLAPFEGAPGNEVVIQPGDIPWGSPQGVYEIDPQGNLHPRGATQSYSRDSLWQTEVQPWVSLATAGTGVHVGEWGVIAQTPHRVALAWMRDCLENWRRAGFGWALWNLRGSFGPLDSDRSDVDYEPFAGHQLDRAMLDLLRGG